MYIFFQSCGTAPQLSHEQAQCLRTIEHAETAGISFYLQDHQQLFAFTLDDADRSAIQEVLADGKSPSSDCYQWERGLSNW